MVMFHTGERPRKVPAVLTLTGRIHHVQPEVAADGTPKQFYEVL